MSILLIINKDNSTLVLNLLYGDFFIIVKGLVST